MPKPTSTMTKAEIEEELLNNDLMCSGGVESEETLHKMNVEEKKELLRGIEQSKEEYNTEPVLKSLNKSSNIDTSLSDFPPLPATGKPNRLKLPRKSTSADSDEGSNDSLNIFDNIEAAPQRKRFMLPGCVDDGAPPLPLPEREWFHDENPYYVKKNEQPAVALKRILAHHDTWKALYDAEMSKIESRALGENIDSDDCKEIRNLPRNHNIEEKENDSFNYESDLPLSKVQRKRETSPGLDGGVQPNSRLQRRASRDSDCEEVEPVVKPEQPKVGDWMTATNNRQRSKRNRKQLPNKQEKGQRYGGGGPDVEFGFDNKWDPRSSSWQRSPQPQGTSTLNNQVQSRKSLPNPIVIEEEKVECPICQRSFAISKVENHAATCEGYSGSPMDVEEEN